MPLHVMDQEEWFPETGDSIVLGPLRYLPMCPVRAIDVGLRFDLPRLGPDFFRRSLAARRT